MLLRRLTAVDAPAFRSLRLEGFRLCGAAFRYAPEDEADLPLAHFERRLTDEHVFGLFARGALVGVAGLTPFREKKMRHKALLWGMYVREAHRRRGGADQLMTALLEAAHDLRIEQIGLTVLSGNVAARRLYERWGFLACGVEPRAVKCEDGTYLDEAFMIRHC